jgi:general secretion pathway protein G
MMIVLAIVGVVFAIAVPAIQTYLNGSRIRQAKIELGEIQRAIREYDRSKGALPDGLTDVTFSGVKLSDRRDPWGQPYEYFNLRTAKGNGQARKDKKLAPLNSDFDLYSVGADGITHLSLGNAASRDDIVRARDGAFIGTAEEFDP